MKTAIRKYLRDFIAVAALATIGLLTAYYIVQNQRLRVPVLQERPFELKAEFKTAQAVTPGQGQTVRVAGVRIGDIAGVELIDGRAIVTMTIDREFLPIYRNATILLRPKTGLKDMFLELDPGDRSAGEYEEGQVIPTANTEPDVNADEILAALDSDTRDYLKLLLAGLAQGTEGRARDLGQMLRQLGPLNRASARLNRLVGERRENLRNFIHNFNRLTERLAEQDEEITDWVEQSSTVFETIASEDQSLQTAIGRLPGALLETRLTLEKVPALSDAMGGALGDLRPFVRQLPSTNETVRGFARAVEPVVRQQIRPFVREARPTVRTLTPAVRRLADAEPDLVTSFEKFNRLFDLASYNEGGAQPPEVVGRNEGFLFWLGWLAHNGNSVFGMQDAHGIARKIYLSQDCGSLADIVGGTPLGPAVGAITGWDQLLELGCP